MNTTLHTLSELITIRETITSAQEALDILKASESTLKAELIGAMVDNNLTTLDSPDGLWSSTRVSRKKYTLSEEDTLNHYLSHTRPELLRPDLVAVKKEISKDPAIADCFSVSLEESLTIRAKNQAVLQEETPREFRERVRLAQKGEL